MIPVYEPIIGDDEINSVVAALKRGEISGTFGTAITEFEHDFAKYCGCDFGISVTSGTTALQLAVAALELQPGDEVLVSASTNIATALAVVHNNLIPVPVDSEADTWNLNLDLLEDLITPKTKAIIPVHLFGHPVDMDRLMEIAKKHELYVIEDGAEAHGALCNNKRVGSFGDMSCFSFYANKVITTGEGGMIVTNNPELADKLKLLRNLGFTKPRFRHEVLGYNFRMTGYQAAMGQAQLGKIDQIINEKRRIATTYNSLLSEIPGIKTPTEEEWAFHVYWMYAVSIESEFGMDRDRLAELLAEHGIETRTFFCPMNLQPCLEKVEGFRKTECPVANGIWETGFYLPSSISLSESDIRFITDTIKEVSNK